MIGNNGTVRQIILGAILSSIFIGIDVRPAQAQWTVFDPSQYALQVAKKIEEAARWVETINHYIETYEQSVRQYEKMVESVTNLRGILDKVDEQVMRHKPSGWCLHARWSVTVL
jgi:P-type conjugative transfer protein TrbJ